MTERAFQPARLRLARKLRGLQQTKLAEDVQLTPAAISQFEHGQHQPTPPVVSRLALALKCLPHFFYRPMDVEMGRAFFRSLRKTPLSERERAQSYAYMLGEVASLLDRDVELPRPVIPCDLRLPSEARGEEIERAALRVRATWGVPPGPIAHVVRLLESNGAITAAVGDFDKQLDAFSVWAGERPIVILCTAKGAAKRRRFDAAHELGHLVLHDGIDVADRNQERQAHRFAAAFLLPAEEIEPWLPRRSNEIELLRDGSRTWGVSMQALLYRARVLGTLSESSYRRTMQRMAVRGWRTDEPVEDGPEEAPSILAVAVEALEAGGGSFDDLATRLGVPSGRLARMFAVPEEQPLGRVYPLKQAAG